MPNPCGNRWLAYLQLSQLSHNLLTAQMSDELFGLLDEPQLIQVKERLGRASKRQ